MDGVGVLKTQRGLWLSILMPVFINLCIFLFGAGWGIYFVPAGVNGVLGFIFESAKGWLYTMLWWPLAILFGLVFIISFSALMYLVGSLVTAPFNAMLAERVLQNQGVLQSRPFALGHFIKTTLKMLATALVRAVVLVMASFLLFALSFLPGLNLLTAYCTLIIIAFDASDYALEALHFSFSQRIDFLRKNLAEYMGMAAQLAIFFIIPGAIVLLMPILVIGAADQVAKRRLLDSRSNP